MHLEGPPDTNGRGQDNCRQIPSSPRQGLPTLWELECRGTGLILQEAPDSAQDCGIHGGSDAAGLCILLAGVVDAEQSWRARGDLGFRAMREFVQRA